MVKENQGPIERCEESFIHPSDKTFNILYDKALAAKKDLVKQRHELSILLNKLPELPPLPDTEEHAWYTQTQNEIQSLKEKVSKKHDELMEILKSVEKINLEIQEKKL